MKIFCLLACPKQMSFLIISNKNIYFKTLGNRFGVMVTPNKRSRMRSARVGMACGVAPSPILGIATPSSKNCLPPFITHSFAFTFGYFI